MPALISKLAAAGLGPGLAQAFGNDTADNLAATGTNQATAYQTSTAVARFSTVASGTGCLLSQSAQGDSQIIYNAGANALSVYPPVGHTINGSSANAAYTLNAGSWGYFDRITTTKWLASSDDAANQSFTASGSGAPTYGWATRTAAGKMGDIYSLKDFNNSSGSAAACDGTTDDATGLQSALTWLAANGGTLQIPGDTKIGSAVSVTITSNKPLLIDLMGHRLIMSHTSGIGLTINGGSLRQPCVIRNGIITGNSTASITGVKLASLFGAALRDLLFTGFTGASATVLLLDFVEDTTFDTVQFVQNNGSGSICLDLTNASNANKYSAVQFQENSIAVRIRGGTASNWFSDCLVQSNTGTQTIIVQVTGTDSNITNTHFQRCHFENNGDSTASAALFYFNTDAGKSIISTTISDSMVNGGTQGVSGTLLKFSATGSPSSKLTTRNNYFINAASVASGLANGSDWVSLNDSDTIGTGFAPCVVLGPSGGGGPGIQLSPAGGAKKFQIYAGYPGQFDGFFVLRDVSGGADLLRWNSSIFTVLSAIASNAAITSSSATAGIGYATGAGGAVTQTTSRTTGVTLNKITGAITTDTTSLSAEAAAKFTVSNSTVAAADTVVASIKSGSNGGNTSVTVVGVAAGSFDLLVSNNNASGGTAETGAIVINFAVIKAVAA